MNPPKADLQETASGNGALIYIVDDEPMLLELAIVVLEPLGYRIQTFRDPAAAMRAFACANPPPALVITDYAMHAMNGMELVAACRRIQPRQKLLLLSGTVDEEVYRDVTEKPNRFLPKPYQAKQLVSAVQALLPIKSQKETL